MPSAARNPTRGQERKTLAGHTDLTGSYDGTAVNQFTIQPQPVQ